MTTTLEHQIDMPESGLGSIKSHLFQNWSNPLFWESASKFGNDDVNVTARDIIVGIRIQRPISNLLNHFVRDRPQYLNAKQYQ